MIRTLWALEYKPRRLSKTRFIKPVTSKVTEHYVEDRLVSRELFAKRAGWGAVVRGDHRPWRTN